MAKAERKAQENLKRAEKNAASQRVEDGIRRLAVLELAREEEERREVAYAERLGDNDERKSLLVYSAR